MPHCLAQCFPNSDMHTSPWETWFKTQFLIQEVWREAQVSVFLTSSPGNWAAHPQPLEWQGPGEFQMPGPFGSIF